MSCKLIRTENGTKTMVSVNSAEDYRRIRNGSYVKRLLKKIREEGKTEEKIQLPQFNNNLAADGPLKNCKILGKSCAADVDFHAPETLSTEEKKAWLNNEIERAISIILAKKDEIGLLMLERSAGKGLHLVWRRRTDLTQIGNLKWAEQTLGLPIDWNAKDVTHVFFTTSAEPEDLLFLSDELFDNTPAEMQVEEEDETHSHRTEHTATDTFKAVDKRAYNPSAKFGNYLFSDIIKEIEEQFYDGKFPVEGERNVRTYEYALILRSICDYRIEQLQEVIPNYWGEEGEEEYIQCILNALKEPKKSMPYRLRKALDALKKKAPMKIFGGSFLTPPPLPRRLPKLLRLLTKNVAEPYKAAVSSAFFAFLAAHIHGVKFKYTDNKLHEPTFMTVVVGQQSIGKSYIKEPIECIMKDILAKDASSRAREAEWKHKNPSSKAKKDPRPEDIVIQMLTANMTPAVLTQRLCDANRNGERFCVLLADEVECLKKAVEKHTLEEVSLLIRMAFDNSLWGQDRFSAESVTGIAPLRFNFCLSTTPKNLKKFFYSMVNDGAVSRLDLATITLPEDDDFMPKIGNYNEAFMAELRPFLEKLEAANGLIECKQANKLAEEIRKENLAAYRLYDSDAYRVFSRRANVISWLKGMVLYIANGMKWDKSIEDFVRWSEQYNLFVKMRYFGEQLEKELSDETTITHQSGPQNLLDLLPDGFTKVQYQQMRHAQGLTAQGDSTLRAWKNRGYIAFDEVSDLYVKTDFYLTKLAGKV